MLNNANSTIRSRSPFTPTQWQELEHQALIYKYLDSGVPVPSELIFSVKRSLESSLASRIFPHQSMGWGCFQVGFGRKTDPEPGRCRRTDGKKWRCSKEAYPDSKYCERHMHRGRNRSRKPVELTTSTPQTSSMPMSNLNPVSVNRNQHQLSSSSASPSPSANNSPYSFSPLSSSPVESDLLLHNTIRTSPYLYPHHSSDSSSSSTSRPSASGSTHNLFLESGSSLYVDKDYRNFNGIKEGSDEKAFFPESSGNLRSLQDSYHNIAMGTASYKSFSQSQFERLEAEATSKHQRPDNEQQQHCFVLGTDFKSPSASAAAAAAARPIKLEKEAETQKSLHHFFGKWPPKNPES